MDESVVVRRGAPADAEAIRGLVEAAYTKWIPVIGRLPIPMQADYAQALRDHRFDLLRTGPDLAGLIETRAEADHLLVVNVAVDPAFQGRGFGSRLMGRADAVAAEAGLARLRLYTNKKYTANLRLYGALGYRVEREELYDGPGRTRDDDVTVHMVKDLV
ncbi:MULTISPECIES: GNAT family N-acetyltransferase [unclassified Methylobacterium]|jgi:ribosomal protein S18 acetylase RimI-like enzyme|uniref:GNAT family N-acetyltransferase n=1 Tax=unclassified Methylobacterium TaxID=2615210 RepID=UPI0005B7AA52|nr:MULTISPECIES: GNAT family N-acetyltransferase [unclassified Methylobacterium]WFS09584.1 GNAT family N-acetyltransferase [Methylobacterium sp. 391_Methyba4]SFU31212.1 Acetyltransferase (GNAT) family protein [Methylobacterium sp. UNCCL125]